MQSETDKIASKYLGKKTENSCGYDASLLVAVPRLENRKQYSIDDSNLPFRGFDVWHAYEFSALTGSGVPVTRVLKLRYSCDNKFLVESKSLKLYLNSFNMSKFGSTAEECLGICRRIIEKDLNNVLETKVETKFLDNNSPKVDIFNNYENIMKYVDETSLKIEEFKEAPHLLQIDIPQGDTPKEYHLTFDSLRSNCRVTHQPDFGDVFIYYKSKAHIKEDSLVKYLVSFRSEYHFHEECCEMIYKRLYDLLEPDDELMVTALYTRRGGIDICPSRRSLNCSDKDIEGLFNLEKFARYGIKQ